MHSMMPGEDDFHDPLDTAEEDLRDPPKRMRQHWYRMWETECVLCWKHDKFRERVYGKRPADRADRHVFEQYLCPDHYGC